MFKLLARWLAKALFKVDIATSDFVINKGVSNVKFAVKSFYNLNQSRSWTDVVITKCSNPRNSFNFTNLVTCVH